MKVLLFLLNEIPPIKGRQQGFTLLELLIVIIIIGILSAVSLPAFLRQIGKARETEMKNTVGAINRTQQAYHFEKEAFAANLVELGVTIQFGDYLDGAGVTSPSSDLVYVLPSNTDAIDDRVRLYGGGVKYVGGSYTTVSCQTKEVITGATVALATSDVNPTAVACTTASGPAVTTLDN